MKLGRGKYKAQKCKLLLCINFYIILVYNKKKSIFVNIRGQRIIIKQKYLNMNDTFLICYLWYKLVQFFAYKKPINERINEYIIYINIFLFLFNI